MDHATDIARLDVEKILNYVRRIKNASEVVLFGTGVRGNAIHVFLKANGVSNITALCDNQSDKVGKQVYGTDIMAVDTAVERFPEALYIMTSSANEKEMRKQLEGAGIPGEQIISYPLMTDPLFCTNCMIREKLKNNG
jgi:NADH/NAD ratio-sensing transcriptional regulator Rex